MLKIFLLVGLGLLIFNNSYAEPIKVVETEESVLESNAENSIENTEKLNAVAETKEDISESDTENSLDTEEYAEDENKNYILESYDSAVIKRQYNVNKLNKDNLTNPDGLFLETNKTKIISLFNLYLKNNIGDSINWRLNYTAKVAKETEQYTKQYIRELDFTLDITESIDITLGKSIIERGYGYYKQPTQFIKPTRESNSLEKEINKDYKIGNLASQIAFTQETYNISINFAEDETKYLTTSESTKQIKTELFFNYVGEDWDFSLNYAWLKNKPYALGFGVSSGVGDSLVTYAEIARNLIDDRLRPVKMQNSPPSLPAMYQYEKAKVISRNSYLLGGQYTFETDFNIILEYLYNGLGFSTEEQELIKDGIESAHSGDKLYENNNYPYGQFLATTFDQNNSKHTSKNYIFLRINSNSYFDSFVTIWQLVHNKDDKSGMFVNEIKYSSSDRTEISMKNRLNYGDKYSEFGYYPHHHVHSLIFTLFL